jgi:hypothetical protein
MLKHVLAAIVAVVAICLLGVEQAHAAANASLESSAPQASDFLDDERLAMALRTGGYVIYFRHTATDFSKSDSQMRTYGDCTNQRLLSDVGRQDARDIGLRIRALRPDAKARCWPARCAARWSMHCWFSRGSSRRLRCARPKAATTRG